MVIQRIYNTIFGAAIVIAAVTGTMALQHAANSPAVLFVAGQMQMAAGNTSNGLSLIKRAAQVTPAQDETSGKPSPAKVEMNCKSKVQPQVVQAAAVKPVARVHRDRGIPVAFVDPAKFQTFSQSMPPVPTVAGNPVVMKIELPAVPSTEEMNRRVRIIKKRVSRTVFRRQIAKQAELQAMLSQLQQVGAFARAE